MEPRVGIEFMEKGNKIVAPFNTQGRDTGRTPFEIAHLIHLLFLGYKKKKKKKDPKMRVEQRRCLYKDKTPERGKTKSKEKSLEIVGKQRIIREIIY